MRIRNFFLPPLGFLSLFSLGPESSVKMLLHTTKLKNGQNQRMFHTTEQLTHNTKRPCEKSLKNTHSRQSIWRMGGWIGWIGGGAGEKVSQKAPKRRGWAEQDRVFTKGADRWKRGNRWNRRKHHRPATKSTKYSLFERQRDLLFSRSPALLRRLLRIFSVTRWQLQYCVRCCRDFRLGGKHIKNLLYLNRDFKRETIAKLNSKYLKIWLAKCRHRKLSAPRNTPTGPHPLDPDLPTSKSTTSRTWARSPAWR